MMSPYFSLILPVYNVAPYLKRCIDSILEQDFNDYEIILVDDGSTDASAQICDTYAENYPNIRVIHKANGGLSSARNAGFEVAEGEYIWWIDSDDWIEHEALPELYRAGCSNRPDIIKFNYYRVVAEQQAVIVGLEPGLYKGTENVEKLLNKAFYSVGEFSLSAWGHVYRREFLKKLNLRFVSERIIGSEDYLFNLSALPHASAVCVLPALLYNYEMREGSLSNHYKKDLFRRYEELYRLLIKEYQRTEILDHFRDGISFFFAWHLIRGTCITQEYQVSKEHSFKAGRRNVKEMLRSRKLQEALFNCDTRRLSRKQQIMMMAMKLKSELFFYFLYVLKPKIDRCI